jgi:hypothetical protein
VAHRRRFWPRRGDDGSNVIVGDEPVTDATEKLGGLVRGSSDIGWTTDARKQGHERRRGQFNQSEQLWPVASKPVLRLGTRTTTLSV